MNLLRAICIGAALAILFGGSTWRTIVGTALLTVAFLITDWIAEDLSKKRQRNFAERLLRGEVKR